jgi:hypothetical protein
MNKLSTESMTNPSEQPQIDHHQYSDLFLTNVNIEDQSEFYSNGKTTNREQ